MSRKMSGISAEGWVPIVLELEPVDSSINAIHIGGDLCQLEKEEDALFVFRETFFGENEVLIGVRKVRYANGKIEDITDDPTR